MESVGIVKGPTASCFAYWVGVSPPVLVDRVLRYGREVHDHHGATVYLIDRAGEARIAREGEARGAELERLRGVYVVVATDGTIRTVGHRTRRLRRH